MLTLALVTGGKEIVLEAFKADPLWQSVRLKTAEAAASRLVGIAEQIALTEAAELLRGDLTYTLVEYIKNNGQRTEANKDDWDSGLDDQVQQFLEPFANTLSASWLFEMSVDTRLQEPGEVDRLCKSFAKEVWKQLTWRRTENQILAGVGIVGADYIGYTTSPDVLEAEPEPEPMNDTELAMSVNAVLNKIILSFPDPNTLLEHLDQVSDDDDPLSQTSMPFLGLTDWQDVLALREARSRSGAAVEAWKNAIEAGEMLDVNKTYADLDPADDEATAAPAAPPPPPPSPVGGPPGMPPPPIVAQTPSAAPTVPAGASQPPPPPPVLQTGAPPSAPKRPGRKAAVASATTIPVATLETIKNHTGVKDEILADMLGISRPTLGNIMKGKAFCDPPAERRVALANMVKGYIDQLQKALPAIGA